MHGGTRPWELPESAGLPDAERELLRKQLAQEIIHAKTRGIVPAGWLRWAEEFMEPQVDWRKLLKRRVRGALVTGMGQRVDYSLCRPHRRADAYAPFLLPALRGDFLPRVACVVDTSGSISDEELSQALAEIRAVLETLRTPVVVIPCDAVPYDAVRVFTRSDLLQLSRDLPGGGGTDMVAGIEAALRLRPAPDTVIVLTDGYTPFPDHLYRTPVLFGILDPRGSGEVPLPPMPPWRKENVVIIPVRVRFNFVGEHFWAYQEIAPTMRRRQ